MMEYAKRTLGGIDWIRAGQVLGVPAMGMLFLLFVGFYFVRAQSSQWAKDSETRQELLQQLVAAQIKQGEATTTTMIKTQAAMEKLEAISEQQVVTHSKMAEMQQETIGNQKKIIEGVTKDCDSTKELILVQKKILESLESTRTRQNVAPPNVLPAKPGRGPVTSNGEKRGPT